MDIDVLRLLCDTNRMETPICQALLICEQVIQDEQTKRHTIVNVLPYVAFPKLPGVIPRLAVFAMLSNGNGQADLHLKCTKLDNDQQIFSTTAPVRFPDPNAVVAIALGINSLPIHEAGLYAFTLTSQEDILAEARVQILVIPPRTKSA